jgi:hypothetical protein
MTEKKIPTNEEILDARCFPADRSLNTVLSSLQGGVMCVIKCLECGKSIGSDDFAQVQERDGLVNIPFHYDCYEKHRMKQMARFEIPKGKDQVR